MFTLLTNKLEIYFLTWQTGLTDVIKGVDLEIEDHFGMSTWIQCNHNVIQCNLLYVREAREPQSDAT